MTTLAHKLTDIVVKAYFPAPSSLEEQIVTGGTGVLTFSDFGGQIHYHFRLDGGNIVNKPRMGDVVTVSGKDQDNKLLVVGPLHCHDDGTPARFHGPAPAQN